MSNSPYSLQGPLRNDDGSFTVNVYKRKNWRAAFSISPTGEHYMTVEQRANELEKAGIRKEECFALACAGTDMLTEAYECVG